MMKKEDIKKYALGARLTFIFLNIVLNFLILIGIMSFFIIKVGISPEHFKNPLFGMWLVVCLCSILSSMVSYFLIRKIFAPLEVLSKATVEVSKGNFDVQVAYDGKLEELNNTISNFNRMVKELNSVEIMRNDFVADVSHEFKTPLAAITGYATFLQDLELSQEEKDEYIRKIFFNVDKLNELTENILQLSKLEHQQFLNEPVRYRLDEQLREAIVLLEPKWGRKNTNFELELPELEYIGQKSLLFQVWMNIIGNAVKYTEDNGTIEVYLKESADYYEVIIRDDGIGMSEETQEHMFEKFYQADTSRKAQGNGLGLALCKEIINKCEGKIIVESRLGEGTVFMILLPKITNSQQNLTFS